MKKFTLSTPVWLGITAVLTYSLLTGAAVQAQEIETETQFETTQQEATPSAESSPTAEASPTGSETAITSVETSEVSGEVMKVDSNSVTIQSSEDVLEIPFSENIRITRDGNDAQPTDIKPGDNVRAVIESDSNQAITLDATSEKTAAMQQWVLPAVIAGLLLLGLIYWLFKKANRQHIKTTQTNL